MGQPDQSPSTQVERFHGKQAANLRGMFVRLEDYQEAEQRAKALEEKWEPNETGKLPPGHPTIRAEEAEAQRDSAQAEVERLREALRWIEADAADSASSEPRNIVDTAYGIARSALRVGGMADRNGPLVDQARANAVRKLERERRAAALATQQESCERCGGIGALGFKFGPSSLHGTDAAFSSENCPDCHGTGKKPQQQGEAVAVEQLRKERDEQCKWADRYQLAYARLEDKLAEVRAEAEKLRLQGQPFVHIADVLTRILGTPPQPDSQQVEAEETDDDPECSACGGEMGCEDCQHGVVQDGPALSDADWPEVWLSRRRSAEDPENYRVWERNNGPAGGETEEFRRYLPAPQGDQVELRELLEWCEGLAADSVGFRDAWRVGSAQAAYYRGRLFAYRAVAQRIQALLGEREEER